ncbi:MAG: bifunctional phosphopantothenoylcysteine decarboxylase/phosphopantothenate--cysteine ligase CoaBC [Chloroflexi bacterium]|nr:bifunctional phosphopantothenoylcysteine decarboxylase/phosphopantothenate--cysteine ligase CoaBC [Chloroflexota bacterium]
MNLTGKRILLAVTGSIAAYKACTVASMLTKAGAHVDTIMTRAACEFVAPLTFEALTGRPVYTDMWNTTGGLATHIAHVGLAHEADMLLVAPCTAQSIARLALGLSDDLLGVTALAVLGRKAVPPVVIAPAMDAGMFNSPATQAHVETLQSWGVVLAGPEVGRMASGFEGLGRLAEPDTIVGVARQAMGRHSGALRGSRVVVTAGPTREPLDPVRFLSNRSSGRQGFAIAQAAVDEGAEVTLITGPVSLPTPIGVKRIDITTAVDLRDAVLEQATGAYQAEALIMAAAVGDFRPAQTVDQKIKKKDGLPTLTLAHNPDILREVAQAEKGPKLVIGFAAESQDLVANAQAKLQAKSLDLIVANDITAADAGFAVETNRVHFVTEEGAEALPLMGKDEVAARLIRWAAARLH